MKAKEIQELLDFIAQSGLAEVNIETEQFKISVKKHQDTQPKYIQTPVQPIMSQQPVITNPVQQVTADNTQGGKTEKQAEPAKDNNYITIKSPMIGTFYRSANPESPAFINVGDSVEPGKAVCIIEAMKLFNEIESEVSGKIVKILVENATPVEYDQPLFLVEPK
ncbi:MAG: acetyl-CoA carboxylase biotin carboxyl carrier protein [Cytophagaceae bacterium]